MLEGATRALSRGRIRHVLTEYNGFWHQRRDLDPEAFFARFERHGYRPRRLNLDVYEAILADSHPPDAVMNLLFTRSDLA